MNKFNTTYIFAIFKNQESVIDRNYKNS